MIKTLRLKKTSFAEFFKNDAFLSIIFNALGKGVYFIFIVLITRLLKVSAETDVYFFTIEFIKIIVAYSLIISTDVIVPKIIVLKTENSDSLKSFLGFFYSVTFLLGIFIWSISYLFPESLLYHFSKFPPSVIDGNFHVFALLFPTLFLNMLANIQSAILVSYNYFNLPSIFTFVGNCISLIIFFMFYKTYGIKAAIAGLIIGNAMTNLCLAYFVKIKCDTKIKLTLRVDMRIFKSINYITLVYTTSLIGVLILMYLLTAGVATTTTAFNYGSMIAFIPHQFIGVQIITIISNRIAELYNTQQYAQVKLKIKQTFILLTLLVFPIGLLYITFSDTIVRFMARENVNSSLYIYNFSTILKYMALPAYFNSIFLLGLRIYTITLKIKVSTLTQTGFNILLISGYYIGLKYYGIEGLGIAIFIVYSIGFILGLVLIKRFVTLIEHEESLSKLKCQKEVIY
jgi:peptidoglycan biosynthesis protein MviN/MurJ (putative lipid II flippase)